MSLSRFIAALLGLTTFMFLWSWAGLGNGPNGPGPGQWWGDPISFPDALAKLPRIALTALLALLVYMAVGGIRSAGADVSRP